MKDSPALHIKTYLLLLVMVLFAPLGNVLLSKGMKGVGAATDWRPADLSHVLMRISGSGFIWLGIAALLTWADYSYVQPASAFSYAVVAILSYIILDESVSPLRWAGIAVICIGVLVVGRTPHRTTLERTGA